MLKLRFLLIAVTLNISFTSYGQENSADSLLNDLNKVETSQPLLPNHIFVTQRLLWGEKGLFRITNLAPLTAEHRESEMKTRRTMLKLHQVAGFITLAGMIAQGIVGSQLYNNPTNELRHTHEALGTFVNFSYATTALLSFTAPPPLVNRKGVSSIKIHKGLAFVHLTGMIVTNILADKAHKDPSYKDAHRAAAYTTFASFALATIVIKF